MNKSIKVLIDKKDLTNRDNTVVIMIRGKIACGTKLPTNAILKKTVGDMTLDMLNLSIQDYEAQAELNKLNKKGKK